MTKKHIDLEYIKVTEDEKGIVIALSYVPKQVNEFTLPDMQAGERVFFIPRQYLLKEVKCSERKE